MDVQMPEMDGFECTSIIREKEGTHGCHLPIIAMTAHALESDREHCRQVGMDGYVSKPINSHTLFEEIARVTRETADVCAGPLAVSTNRFTLFCGRLT